MLLPIFAPDAGGAEPRPYMHHAFAQVQSHSMLEAST